MLNDFSTEQRRAISDSMNDSMNGPVAWMNLVTNNMSRTIEAMFTSQNKLRVMKLSSYPGEDFTIFRRFANDYRLLTRNRRISRRRFTKFS